MKTARKLGLAILALALLFCGELSAFGQSVPLKYLSAASTNSTLVLGKSALLNSLVVVNTTTTLYYLKLYNKATAPTCGTDTPAWTIPVPFGASSSGGGVTVPMGQGLIFSSGLGFCLTGAIADSDTTVAATGVAINFGVSGR